MPLSASWAGNDNGTVTTVPGGMTPSERGGLPWGSAQSSKTRPGAGDVFEIDFSVMKRSSRKAVPMSAGLESAPASTTTMGAAADPVERERSYMPSTTTTATLATAIKRQTARRSHQGTGTTADPSLASSPRRDTMPAQTRGA